MNSELARLIIQSQDRGHGKPAQPAYVDSEPRPGTFRRGVPPMRYFQRRASTPARPARRRFCSQYLLFWKVVEKDPSYKISFNGGTYEKTSWGIRALRCGGMFSTPGFGGHLYSTLFSTFSFHQRGWGPGGHWRADDSLRPQHRTREYRRGHRDCRL